MYRLNWERLLIRAGFVVFTAALSAVFRPFGWSPAFGALFGSLAGIAVNLLELRLQSARLSVLVGACLGALLGGILGVLFVLLLNPAALVGSSTAQFFRLLVPYLFGFVGLLVGTAKSDLLDLNSFGLFAKGSSAASTTKILDTSVLIDGRIADIAETGFLEGALTVPLFVLHELQLIADSSDSAKRNRGRRGLDVVQRLQKTPGISIELSAQDFPSVREVDLKLIELAKLRQAKIMTNDFNLNKLAHVQGLDILNINELANKMRPVVLPGETMRVFILKEGKEYNQGVAYLDDGTMVVVDNARRHISKTVDVTVTSVLQTTAGKMIFGRYDERSHSPGEPRSAAASASGSSPGI